MTTAAVLSSESTVTITQSSWSDVVKLAEDGKAGRSIANVTNYYLAVANSSDAPTWSTAGWVSDAIPSNYNANRPYLWNYEVIADEKGTEIKKTSPSLISTWGRNGTDGSDGRGIKSIIEYYAVTTTPSEPA